MAQFIIGTIRCTPPDNPCISLDQQAAQLSDSLFVEALQPDEQQPAKAPVLASKDRCRVFTRSTAALLSLALGSSSLSCSAPKKATETWTARPHVPWNRVTNGTVPLPEDGYQLLMTAPTSGLFPANLAVTRVAIADEADQSGSPMLFADPRNEFLQWNRAFDDQMAISEVFPIDQRDLGGGPAEPEQILAAFRALHARVGLIYAVNEQSPYQSEMYGALYDTHTGSVLATIHAKAQAPPIEDKNVPMNPWESDSRALVRKKFEKHAYAAIYALIQQDQPTRVDPPAGWTPAGPIKPVEWPPRQRRIP